jgi:hypothetical protein
VTVHTHCVELANVATDYKFQGRSETHIMLSMLLPASSTPRLDIHGLYVLLTRTARGREGIRLLLAQGADSVRALNYLLSLERPKDLIIFLRGYDVDGHWQLHLAEDAYRSMTMHDEQPRTGRRRRNPI